MRITHLVSQFTSLSNPCLRPRTCALESFSSHSSENEGSTTLSDTSNTALHFDSVKNLGCGVAESNDRGGQPIFQVLAHRFARTAPSARHLDVNRENEVSRPPHDTPTCSSGLLYKISCDCVLALEENHDVVRSKGSSLLSKNHFRPQNLGFQHPFEHDLHCSTL